MAPNRLHKYTILPQGESEPLNPPPTQQTYTRWNRRRIFQWALPAILAISVILALTISQVTRHEDAQIPPANQEACPQYPALRALSEGRKKVEDEVKKEINSDAFFDKSLKRLQGAVQIPTESFDDMGEVGEDPRWDVFVPFQEYLKTTFPLV